MAAKTPTDKAKDAIVKAMSDRSVNVPLLVSMLIQEAPWLRDQLWIFFYSYVRIWTIKQQHPTSDMTAKDHAFAFVMSKVNDFVKDVMPGD